MKIDKNKYTKPCIVLGNGLNNYLEMDGSWIGLLDELSSKISLNNLLNTNELSYPEFYDALAFQNGKGMIEYKSLKQDICKKISNWNGLDGHFKLTKFARDNDIPIITTNYDYTLIDEVILNNIEIVKNDKYVLKKPKKIKGTEKKFTDYYPWHAYYSEKEITNARDQFGVWHMHGIACYERSISIGAIDYGNNISRYKKYIGNKSEIAEQEWIGKNSWLDIFMNNDLIIIGLSLMSQETSFRWLLMEREKFFRKNENLRRKTLFVINDEFDIYSKGKKFLFDSLNIESLKLPNGMAIYDNWQYS
jgi:hypothetical protein